MLLEAALPASPPIQTRTPNSSTVNEIQSLLMVGEKAEACQLALREGLWDHALMLASRISTELFNEVIARCVRVCVHLY